MNISINLCNALAATGREVLALGIGYNGEEHSWDFGILPVASHSYLSVIPAIIHNLMALQEQDRVPAIDAIVIAMDIPPICNLYRELAQFKLPVIGLYPVESPPICATWAAGLAPVEKLLCISKFGTSESEKAGLEAEYIPLGIDTKSWRMPTPFEREKLREQLGMTGKHMVLTVADNHERKNLAAAAEIIAKASKEVDVQWVLVTRKDLFAGWKIDDLLNHFGITDRTMVFERGLAFDRLWILYAAADVFLLTSKAEGFCMPILEAMATYNIVMATDCTAITEHIEDGRGIRLPVEFMNLDVWGNSYRSYIDIHLASLLLAQNLGVAPEHRIPMIMKAREYAESRKWDVGVEVLVKGIEEAIAKKAAAKKSEAPEGEQTIPQLGPVTFPHPIPVMVEEIKDEQKESQS